MFGRVRFQLTDYLLAAPVFCAPLLDERTRDVGPRVVRALGGGAGVRARIPCDEFCLTRQHVSVPSAYHFDVLLGERDLLLPTEERQQDEHALVRPLTLVETELPAKRPLHDAHSLAGAKSLTLG